MPWEAKSLKRCGQRYSTKWRTSTTLRTTKVTKFSQINQIWSILTFAMIAALCSVGCSEPEQLERTPQKGTAPMLRTIPGLDASKELFSVDEVRVPDEWFVTGVVVNGEARAYLESGMYKPENHLVHDSVGGSNITVAFCNETLCSRVFTGDSDELQAVRMGGWKDENLQLLINGVRHPINSPDIGLKDQPFKTITWGEWKRSYPDTKIYLGHELEEFRRSQNKLVDRPAESTD
ncbi:MAG: hypothetical protein ACPGVU_15775 [Limisphaerales bacterium]